MRVAVLANDQQFTELTSGNSAVTWIRCNDFGQLAGSDAELLVNLEPSAYSQDYAQVTKPVFINSVTDTLAASSLPENIVRFNGWRGFVAREMWEISGKPSKTHLDFLQLLNKKHTILPDEPGFVSARIISMIINEACFAMEEEISSETEIDTAMKLGTNYPKGPFEWQQEIGAKEIHKLLEKLSETDTRYIPSSLLAENALQN